MNIRRLNWRASLILLILSIVLLNGCSDESNTFQGYVEGELRYIASNLPGKLIKLQVQRGDKVKFDQTLFILEEQPEQSDYLAAKDKVTSAQAQVDRLNANVNVAQIRYDRRLELHKKNFSAQEEVDLDYDLLQEAKKQRDAAISDMKAAIAELDKASWMVTKKQYKAPIQSMVFDTFFKPGEYVAADQPVLALLATEDIKYVFYVTETKLNSIKIGDQVSVSCDGCTKGLKGTVYYISPKPEFTQPIIYGEQTRSKLSFLIEAHPDANSASQLHPGQPITVKLIH